MKRIIVYISTIVLFASCSNNASNEQARQQQVIDSLKTEAMKQHIIDSVNQANAMQQSQQVNQEVVPTSRHIHHEYGNSGIAANSSTAENTTGKKRKGWSAKAKGAVIGAGVGGITGALTDKNKAQGAVIGTVLGAAAGTGVGAVIDNKDKKKNK